MFCLWNAVILAVVSNVWTILAIENFHFIVLIEDFEMALLFGFALFLDQFDGSIQGDGQRIILLWNRNILAVMEDVRAVAARSNCYSNAFIITEFSWQLEEFQLVSGLYSMLLRILS